MYHDDIPGSQPKHYKLYDDRFNYERYNVDDIKGAQTTKSPARRIGHEHIAYDSEMKQLAYQKDRSPVNTRVKRVDPLEPTYKW